MIADIEAGKVKCVITKDLSRLGRNYIEAGSYIEIFFPRHNVRYIAVTDGVDSLNRQEMDITPFKNILNDMYSRDISKPCVDKKDTGKKQRNKIKKYGKNRGNKGNKGKKSFIFQNSLSFQKIYAPEMQNLANHRRSNIVIHLPPGASSRGWMLRGFSVSPPLLHLLRLSMVPW